MKIRKYSILGVLAALLIALQVVGCSPTYIARAGWEEAKILWNKKPIEEVIANNDTSPKLRETLFLVQSVREFTKLKGLNPGGSYSEYCDIGRDVLVWVLSGAQKNAFSPVTWWFPIVGRVPYKGFFDKEDAVSEAKKLKEEGYDIYLRSSPAFSTLGWFDDPFLSTMSSGDQIEIANVIIHEVLHNTLWIKNSASFNETMANVTGAAGAIAFFEERDGLNSALAIEARARFADELIYASYLQASIDKIKVFYKKDLEKKVSNSNESKSEDFLLKREELFSQIVEGWEKERSSLKTNSYQNFGKNLNNAVILSRRVYFDRYKLFHRLYLKSEGNFEQFLSLIQELALKANKSDIDIWQALSEKLEALDSLTEKS